MLTQSDPDRMQRNVASLIAARRENPRIDVADELFKQKVSWPELMKSLRQVQDINLPEAQRVALSHDGWRRWCELQINSDPKCRKEALHHMRHFGSDALVESEGGRFRVR